MTMTYFFAATLVGLVGGSFLNVVIPRLHEDKPGILFGRSICPHCKEKLGVFELIPLVSYICLLGKCKRCKNGISTWYPLIEIITAMTFGALVFYSSSLVEWIWHSVLFLVLLFIFFYDLRYKEIHDLVLIPSIVLALIASFFIGDPIASLLGGVIGYIFFALQYMLSRGKWIGSGDLRIGAFIGLMLGWKLVFIALVLGYFIGSIISLILLMSNKVSRKSTLPLGPFLVTGTMIAFFCGDKLLEWYIML